jgi:ABC-2 type transport system permease protein
LIAVALTWLSVALGLAAKSVESASNTPMFLMLLPFLGSGFVPTDGMPVGLRWFAEYQPFTPFIETLGDSCWGHRSVAAPWSPSPGSSPTLAGYLWAKKLYNRDPIK